MVLKMSTNETSFLGGNSLNLFELTLWEHLQQLRVRDPHWVEAAKQPEFRKRPKEIESELEIYISYSTIVCAKKKKLWRESKLSI